jgi:hypothetical protein
MATVCQWFGLKTTQTVCKWFGLKTTRTAFSCLTSKHVVMVFSGSASKLVVTVFTGLSSKPAMTVSGSFTSKPVAMVSDGLASKPTATVSGGLTSKPAATVSAGLASKPVVMVSTGLASKPVVTVSTGLALKPDVTVSQFEPQTRRLQFGDLCLKITAVVSWFGPQNQVGFDLPVVSQTNGRRSTWDTRRDLAACFGWKQIGLGFPSLVSRLAEARRRVVHVVLSWRLRRDKVEDGQVDVTGCVRPCYPYLFVFYVLDPRGIVVFQSFVWPYK